MEISETVTIKLSTPSSQADVLAFCRKQAECTALSDVEVKGYIQLALTYRASNKTVTVQTKPSEAGTDILLYANL